jgi:hypothetical protein
MTAVGVPRALSTNKGSGRPLSHPEAQRRDPWAGSRYPATINTSRAPAGACMAIPVLSHLRPQALAAAFVSGCGRVGCGSAAGAITKWCRGGVSDLYGVRDAACPISTRACTCGWRAHHRHAPPRHPGKLPGVDPGAEQPTLPDGAKLDPYCCPYPCPYCTLPLLTTEGPLSVRGARESQPERAPWPGAEDEASREEAGGHGRRVEEGKVELRLMPVEFHVLCKRAPIRH